MTVNWRTLTRSSPPTSHAFKAGQTKSACGDHDIAATRVRANGEARCRSCRNVIDAPKKAAKAAQTRMPW